MRGLGRGKGKGVIINESLKKEVYDQRNGMNNSKSTEASFVSRQYAVFPSSF